MALSSPEKMLSALTADCKVVVNVINNSRYTLSEPRFFLKSGICQFPPNEPIRPGRHALYGFRNMSSGVKGCHGILGLRFKGTDEYLVLLFKNPLLYERRTLALSMENCAGVCDMNLRKLREMKRQMATADGRFMCLHAGSDCVAVKSEVLGVRVKAVMSACHEPIVHVTVMDDGVGEPHEKSSRVNAHSMENCAGVGDMNLRKLREMKRQEATADGRFMCLDAGSDCVAVKSEVLGVRVKAVMSACHEPIAHVTVMNDGVGEPHEKSSRVNDLINMFEKIDK